MAVTSADILLQRACILPFLKMQKLARKGGCVKSLCSILRDAACERGHMSHGTRRRGWFQRVSTGGNYLKKGPDPHSCAERVSTTVTLAPGCSNSRPW